MLSLMIIKRTIYKTIYGGVPSCDNAKDFLEAIGQKFKESNKANVPNLLNSFLCSPMIIWLVSEYIF